jgi:RNA polymerase sigma-70 factor (ECF subfamily)
MADIALNSAAQIIEAYYGELRAFARRRLGNASLAEDLVQEACLRFAMAVDSKPQNPRAFLYKIIANLLVDQQRNERMHGITVEFGSAIADPTPDAERQLFAKQRLAILAEAIDELPPRCRECFVMRRFDDLDQDEIARRMGISRNMVEKHLRLALAHCAKRLRAVG